MTPLGRYRGIERIRAELSVVRARRRIVRAVVASAGAVTAIAVSLLLAGMLLGYWPDQPPTLVRVGVLVAMLAVWAAAVARVLRRTVFWRPGQAQIARFIERARPQLGNDLVNAVLLSDDNAQPSDAYVQFAIDEAGRNLQRADTDHCVSWRRFRLWSIVAAAALTLLALFATLQGSVLRRGLAGAFGPTTYVPHTNHRVLQSLDPGDTTIFAGTDVTVRAVLDAQADTTATGEVLVAGRRKHPMTAGADRKVFTCGLGARDQTFQYAVRIGTSRWPPDKPWYTVSVVQRVGVESVDLTLRYPAYTRQPARTLRNCDGRVEALVGTVVEPVIYLASPVPAAMLELRLPAGAVTRPMPSGPAEAVFHGEFTLGESGQWRIGLADADGRVVQHVPGGNGKDGTFFPIQAVADRPPTVRFAAPATDTTVAPGRSLPLRITAQDDYGIGAVRLFVSRPDGHFEQAHRFEAWAGPKPRSLQFLLPLAGRREGDIVEYYATATDTRRVPELNLAAQTTPTAHFKVRIQDAAKAAAARAKRLEQLRQRLLAILRMQQIQRVNTGVCREKGTTPAQAATVAGDTLTGQRAIRTAIADTAATFPFDPEMLPVRQVLASLATGEAAVAIRQAEVLLAAAATPGRTAACDSLAATQDTILDTLHTLLGLLPMLARKARGADDSRAGGDLPPDVREKLKDLLAALEKFKADQRKVIDATKTLAKRPVDDFTDADKKLLHDLAAVEDKWEKFLEEAFQDLSKIQEQDFATAKLLKELASIQSDVTMAADALAKKAIDMATAAEENGYANAEEIQHNMEKWLPDEPDRKKWDMEDPTDQQNMEMPELPEQLEDLMGDLLEQEEDLFEEMQDTSSKHGGSMDSGWDAQDGPISTPNADGVTGNQLPNSNEMQGRSGEGRTGKSSGEYVEDKAVGKGGRRTPSRLTPDAYQTGQIDDTSAEPPGGATGGGKLSGSGAEGLEGPVPAPLQKKLQRLAGKQAQLVNRAERLTGQFKTHDYAGFKFLEAITLMNRVQDDLKNHRYHNALRRRKQTLGALRDARRVLTGQVTVEADPAAAMPRHVREDIADAMQDDLPAEYRQALEEYYRRLSQPDKK